MQQQKNYIKGSEKNPIEVNSIKPVIKYVTHSYFRILFILILINDVCQNSMQKKE
mgnify:CR=1 FL=1